MTIQVAIVIYPGFTALDAVGPHHVLAHTAGTETLLVAPPRGRAGDRRRPLTLTADAGLDDVPSPVVVVVAGGMAAFDRTSSGGTPEDPVVACNPAQVLEIVTNDPAVAMFIEERMRALGITGYVRLEP